MDEGCKRLMLIAARHSRAEPPKKSNWRDALREKDQRR
jgi:hypothetical protein